MRMQEDAIAYHVKRFGELKADRGTLDSHLQEIAELMYPEHAYFTYEMYTEGEKKMSKIYDLTGVLMNQLFAAGLFSLLTSSANPWFGIAPVDYRDREDIALVRHLAYESRIMYHEINKGEAGFSTAAHECYMSYGAFGNFCMFVDEDVLGSHMVFICLPMNECYFVSNNKDRVDTLYRKYKRTIQQIVDKFGYDALHTEMKKLYDDGKVDMKVECLHLVEPRTNRNPLSISSTDLPFRSIYIDCKNKHVLKESGYHELPFMGVRLYKTGNSNYGYGVGATALPEVKMLNRAQQAIIRSAQKSVDPTIMIPDQGFLKPFRSLPGGINYYRKSKINMKTDIGVLDTGRPDLGDKFADTIRNRIREAFFVDQLQLHQSGPQMTATEVLQRTEEKLRLLGPLLGRVQPEFLGPLIKRVRGLLIRAGKFPEPPPTLSRTPLKIVYTSPIARAQEQVQANGLLRSFDILKPVWELKNSALDVINEDEITKGVFDMYSVDPRFINEEKVIQQIRQGRADAARKKEEAENLRMTGQGMAGLGRAADSSLPEQLDTIGEGTYLQ